jgi:thiol:disulfide interchange protein DsbD
MLLPALCAAFAPLVATIQDDEEIPDGNTLVKPSLLADVDSIVAGARFDLILRFEIEPKWHVYWTNPGDAGQALLADIKAPEGFVLGAPRHPWPHRLDQEGDIVAYVHEKEVVMLASVVAPAEIVEGRQYEFSFAARWLVCTELCVPGEGKASLSLAGSKASKLANEALAASARKHLPQSMDKLPLAKLVVEGAHDKPVLHATVPGAQELEFFPHLDPRVKMTGRTREAGKSGAKLVADFAVKPPKSGQAAEEALVRGVLWVKTAKGESAYEVALPAKPKAP